MDNNDFFSCVQTYLASNPPPRLGKPMHYRLFRCGKEVDRGSQGRVPLTWASVFWDSTNIIFFTILMGNEALLMISDERLVISDSNHL